MVWRKRDAERTSQGKVSRRHRTPAGFTTPGLMAMDLTIIYPRFSPHRPRKRFLSVWSRLCSTPPSDSASQQRPCASLIFHRHQAG